MRKNIVFSACCAGIFFIFVFINSGGAGSREEQYSRGKKADCYQEARKENNSDTEIKPGEDETVSSQDTTVIDTTNQQKKEDIVYITSTDKKYHKEGCWYLLTKTPVARKSLINKGYGPCRECRP